MGLVSNKTFGCSRGWYQCTGQARYCAAPSAFLTCSLHHDSNKNTGRKRSSISPTLMIVYKHAVRNRGLYHRWNWKPHRCRTQDPFSYPVSPRRLLFSKCIIDPEIARASCSRVSKVRCRSFSPLTINASSVSHV